VDGIRNCRENRLRYVNKMENSHLPKLTLQFQPNGKRDIGPPNTYIEQERMKANKLPRTGLSPKPTTFMMMKMMMIII
jgi:hypothetical protein